MSGESSGDKFGFSVSLAGDVDNDDYDDVVIGAPFNDVGGTSAGRVYIYYGSSSMNAREDVVMTGHHYGPGEALGFSVSDAGDVNNDGYADVMAGAPFFLPGGGMRMPGGMHLQEMVSPVGRVRLWGDPS
ncbi:MAG: FG-GAP repeat protein [Thermoplasmata archaeon]|nr:FG-GAP repeat protein [Thermoplasmata archaeon]